MNEIVTDEQKSAAILFRRLVSLYLENRDLIMMGGYSAGQDPDLDLAVELWPKLMDIIKQPYDQKASFEDSVGALTALFGMAK